MLFIEANIISLNSNSIRTLNPSSLHCRGTITQIKHFSLIDFVLFILFDTHRLIMKSTLLWMVVGATLLFGESVNAWGGIFNRFSPEMLTNMGYGSHSGGGYHPFYQVSFIKICLNENKILTVTKRCRNGLTTFLP